MTSIPIVVDVDVGEPLPTAPGKQCGGCTACCYTVPVKEIGVRAFQTCPHLCGPYQTKHGCSIYEKRPYSCRTWSCSWLIGDLGDEYRPDRCGFVIDPIPDVVTVDDEEKPAAQFWVLRGKEDVWQEPHVSYLIKQVVDTGFIVLWRTVGPDERQWAVAFGKNKDGRYTKSELTPSNEEMPGFASDGERLLRAQEMVRNRRRGEY